MGIVQKQSIRGSVYAYMGAILGFIISGLLFPKFLSTDEIGLINVMVAYSFLFAQFANLGVHNITTRLFPAFRNKENGHNGFFGLALLVNSIGFGLGLILFFILKDYLINTGEGDSTLLEKYIFLLPFLIFSNSFFFLLDDYNKVLYNSTRGIILKEFVLRLLVLVFLFFFIFEYFGFTGFLFLYVSAYLIPIIVLFFVLKKEGKIFFKLKPDFISKDFRKELISVGFYGIIASLTATMVINIDRIMIKDLMNLDAAGIYSTAFFFGILVSLPSRAVLKTISIYIADAFKENNLEKIDDIYQKTSINQSLIGLLLFIGLWINVENIMIILGDEFRPGYWVIFFVGLTFLTDMISGGATVILNNSKSYRMVSLFLAGMTVLLILGNLWLIPIYGIVGSAIASFAARLLFNLAASYAVWWKYKLQPFNRKYLYIVFVGGISYFVHIIIPVFDSYILDILVRSSAVTLVFTGLSLTLTISSELNMISSQILQRVINRLPFRH